MKTKPIVFLLLFGHFAGVLNAQISFFSGSKINIRPTRISESKEVSSEFRITFSSNRGFGLLTYREGEIKNNTALYLKSRTEENPVGFLEIASNDFIFYGATKQKTGDFTPSIARLEKGQLLWSKAFSICNDRTNIGFFAGLVSRGSFLYAAGSSRNSACGLPNIDFCVVKMDLKGNVKRQVSFVPGTGSSTDGLYFLQQHKNLLYYGGFSTRQPCGIDNPQSPGLGTIDFNLQNRRWWTYHGFKAVLHGAINQVFSLPKNPNRLVCNVRFSPDDACADRAGGVGLFVVDSLGNPIKAVRFQTKNKGDILSCRYSKLIPSDESLLFVGSITSLSGAQNGLFIRTNANGKVLNSKIIQALNPKHLINIEDVAISGQRVVMVGRIKSNGKENLIVIETDNSGNLPKINNCIKVAELALKVEPLAIQKREHNLSDTESMLSARTNYLLSTSVVSKSAIKICPEEKTPKSKSPIASRSNPGPKGIESFVKDVIR